jgi:hypothetical protein
MENKHLNENKALKKKLRVFGITLLLLGGLLMMIGLIDFFSPGMPELFFLIFMAMPILFAGSVMTMYGYMGAVARYSATQMAPVAKDTINYMVDGTKASVTGLASGIIKEVKGTPKVETCDHCGHEVQKGKKFCIHCGKKLLVHCPSCDHANLQSAQFCADCGTKLV